MDTAIRNDFLEFAGHVSGTSTLAAQKTRPGPSLSELTISGNLEWGVIVGAAKKYVGTYNPSSVSVGIMKKMMKDPQIAFGMAAINSPIMAMPLRVKCRDPKIRDYVYSQMKPVWLSLKRTSSICIHFGFQVHEKCWTLDDLYTEKGQVYKSQFILKKLKDLDPENITIYVDLTGGFAGVQQGMRPIVPADKCLINTYDKMWGNLYGNGLFENIYDPWYWSTIIYIFCNRYFERKADPSIKAMAPGEQVYDDATASWKSPLAEMVSASQDLKNNGIVVLPSVRDDKGNLVYDIEYLMDDKRADQFLDYIEHLQILKLRGMIVPESVLTRSKNYGTYAEAKEHTGMFHDSLIGTVQDMYDEWNKFLIPQIVDFNFGEKKYLETKPELVPVGMDPFLTQIQEEIVRKIAETGRSRGSTSQSKHLGEINKLIGELDKEADKKARAEFDETADSQDEATESLELLARKKQRSMGEINDFVRKLINAEERALKKHRKPLDSLVTDFIEEARDTTIDSVKKAQTDDDGHLLDDENDKLVKANESKLEKLVKNFVLSFTSKGEQPNLLSDRFIGSAGKLASQHFNKYMDFLGLDIPESEEELAVFGGIFRSLLRNVKNIANRVLSGVQEIFENATSLARKPKDVIDELKKFKPSTRYDDLTVETPFRSEYRRRWFLWALLAGFVAWKMYKNDVSGTPSEISKKYEDKIGTLEYWNRIGERLGEPEPLLRYGLHYGETDFWFPIPDDTIEDEDERVMS